MIGVVLPKNGNSTQMWTANDVYDIDALAIAVPYCDVVVTEKACHHVLTTAGLDRRMRTAILRRLDDLPTALSALTAAGSASESLD